MGCFYLSDLLLSGVLSLSLSLSLGNRNLADFNVNAVVHQIFNHVLDCMRFVCIVSVGRVAQVQILRLYFSFENIAHSTIVSAHFPCSGSRKQGMFNVYIHKEFGGGSLALSQSP